MLDVLFPSPESLIAVALELGGDVDGGRGVFLAFREYLLRRFPLSLVCFGLSRPIVASDAMTARKPDYLAKHFQ
jgi:hypothetical protein